MCKGFEVGVCSVYLRISKEVNVVGVEWERGKLVGDEVSEVIGGRLYRVL